MLFALVFAGARFDHQDAFAASDHAGHVHAAVSVDPGSTADHEGLAFDEEGLPGAFHCGSSILIVLPADMATSNGTPSDYAAIPHHGLAMSHAALEPPPPRA